HRICIIFIRFVNKLNTIMKKIFKYTFLMTMAAIMTACSTVPLSGRKQLSLVSDDQVQQQAAVAYKEFLGSPNTKVVTGTSDATLVKQVGNRIAAAVNQYLKAEGLSNQFNFNWEFNLVQSRSEEHTSELQSRENLVCRL